MLWVERDSWAHSEDKETYNHSLRASEDITLEHHRIFKTSAGVLSMHFTISSFDLGLFASPVTIPLIKLFADRGQDIDALRILEDTISSTYIVGFLHDLFTHFPLDIKPTLATEADGLTGDLVALCMILSTIRPFTFRCKWREDHLSRSGLAKQF